MLKKIILVCIIAATSFLIYDHLNYNGDSAVPVIAITQIAPHPSLDKIRQGFLDTFQKKYPIFKIDYQNAQGSQPLSMQIAQKFVSAAPKLIVAITTPSAMNCYQAAKVKDIPVVFSGVSNPVLAKLVNARGHPLPGLTGVSDGIAPNEQLKFINSLTFKAPIKTIGILYSPGEINAVAQVQAFEEVFKNAQFNILKIPVNNTSDITLATQKAAQDSDMIYVFNDNTVVSGMSQLLKIAHEQNTPVVVSDPESVDLGALAALTYDQYLMGVKTAELAIKIVEGEKVDTISVEKPDGPTIYFNDRVAQKYGVTRLPVLNKQNDGEK
ncbi:MAG: ABC transporter permease [Alphaproteobacteria bacterium CG_4_10_14_0_8_um_filter_37_21]|nr:MAG: ABC transporter permease [Alphaproteobacteria bacterium CG_4_10_14_0_8_um_filter_37_21]